jgi:hypothetical protein
MKDLKMYLPSLRFFVMVVIVWVAVTFIVRSLPASSPWAVKVKSALGYA